MGQVVTTVSKMNKFVHVCACMCVCKHIHFCFLVFRVDVFLSV